MKIPPIYKILEYVDSLKTKKEKIAVLQNHKPNTVLLQLLKYAFDPNVKFDLPETDPPYKKLDDGSDDNGNGLYREARRLYLFIEGGNPNLTKLRRETLFIQLIESLNEKDAQVLLAVKNKTLPYKGITKKLVEEAFPGLL